MRRTALAAALGLGAGGPRGGEAPAEGVNPLLWDHDPRHAHVVAAWGREFGHDDLSLGGARDVGELCREVAWSPTCMEVPEEDRLRCDGLDGADGDGSDGPGGGPWEGPREALRGVGRAVERAAGPLASVVLSLAAPGKIRRLARASRAAEEALAAAADPEGVREFGEGLLADLGDVLGRFHCLSLERRAEAAAGLLLGSAPFPAAAAASLPARLGRVLPPARQGRRALLTGGREGRGEGAEVPGPLPQ